MYDAPVHDARPYFYSLLQPWGVRNHRPLTQAFRSDPPVRVHQCLGFNRLAIFPLSSRMKPTGLRSIGGASEGRRVGASTEGNQVVLSGAPKTKQPSVGKSVGNKPPDMNQKSSSLWGMIDQESTYTRTLINSNHKLRSMATSQPPTRMREPRMLVKGPEFSADGKGFIRNMR